MIAVAIQFFTQNKPQILITKLINSVILSVYLVTALIYISEMIFVVLWGIEAVFSKWIKIRHKIKFNII